jgi:branched-chain amino acid transport system permease protein
MKSMTSQSWKQTINTSLLGGVMTILIALIGMVEAFSPRFIISGIISMGQVFLLMPILIFSFINLRKAGSDNKLEQLLIGAVTGLIGGAVVFFVLLVGQFINLRSVFINASPTLYQIITFKVALPVGYVIPFVVYLLVGLAGAGISILAPRWRKAVIQGLLIVLLLGLLRDLVTTVITRWGPLKVLFKWLFAVSGMTIIGAAVVLILTIGLVYWRSGRPIAPKKTTFTRRDKTIRYSLLGGVAILILLLPQILGIFFSEVLDTVGIYVLMGLGLNIVVGFAGLLDLGYVAFYAIGAYVMGVLTSTGLGFFHLTFWEALPFALVGSVIAGVILGLPVLKVRGDYLAIVTLGFGEIVRLLALSDWLRPYLGGTQGIQSIAQPRIGSIILDNQADLYYLILAGILIALFIAGRLKDSHLGRSWMALREDEDVAQAMGINTLATKLMAFATGAFFSGLAGAIFAAKLTSVYPHSFNFLVSINVLSLIIIGGMGSIPGVIVGSLVMVGVPELLREFAEFRLLAYGAVLVAMMLIRPEGIIPEARRRLELHEEELIEVVEENNSSPTVAGD